MPRGRHIHIPTMNCCLHIWLQLYKLYQLYVVSYSTISVGIYIYQLSYSIMFYSIKYTIISNAKLYQLYQLYNYILYHTQLSQLLQYLNYNIYIWLYMYPIIGGFRCILFLPGLAIGAGHICTDLVILCTTMWYLQQWYNNDHCRTNMRISDVFWGISWEILRYWLVVYLPLWKIWATSWEYHDNER